MLRYLGGLALVGFFAILSPQNSQSAVSLVPNSVQPDTVFREFPYSLGFTVASDAPLGSVDSVFANLEILLTSDSSLVDTVFSGFVTHTSVSGDTLSYGLLTPQSITWPSSGSFGIHFQYALYSGDTINTIDTILSSAINVMAPLAIAYQTGTLAPATVEPGTMRAFSFDVISQAPYALLVDESLSSLYLNGTSFNDTVALSFAYDSLLPALQTFTTAVVAFPGGLPDDSLATSASLAVLPVALAGQGIPSYAYPLSFGSAKVAVETVPVPTIQILNLTVESPNSPKVNTGQLFSIHARIANRSDFAIGPLSFQLVSDGNATFNPTAVIQFIDANSEADLAIDVVAEQQPNPGEVFRLLLTTDGINELPAEDDVAFAIVETPASLHLTYNLFGTLNGVVGYGQTFSVSIELNNTGQSTVTEATYLLTTDGVSFGIPDTIGGSLIVNQDITLNFRAPAYDTQAVFMIQIISPSIELNTGEPAPLDFDTLMFTIAVRRPGGDLFVSATQLSYNVLTTNQSIDLFSILAVNSLTVSTARIRLLSMTVDFVPIGDETITPSAFIDWTVSGIYRNDELISVATPSGSRVILALSEVILNPQESTTLVVRLLLKSNAPDQFTFRQALSDMQAILIEGNTSRQAQVVTETPSTFLYSESYAVLGTSMATSFIVNNNPYDPAAGPALFSYQLQSPSEIVFRLYTITGEMVIEMEFPEGDSHTTAGSHVISWDGKNGDGDNVLNGVYVAVITNTNTGESARIKVAVVR